MINNGKQIKDMTDKELEAWAEVEVKAGRGPIKIKKADGSTVVIEALREDSREAFDDLLKKAAQPKE